VGPILDGIGLSITAWSYDDRIYFWMLACPESIDGPWKLMACFPEALDELKHAAQREDPDVGAWTGRTRSAGRSVPMLSPVSRDPSIAAGRKPHMGSTQAESGTRHQQKGGGA
jgi:hypothetical protein